MMLVLVMMCVLHIINALRQQKWRACSSMNCKKSIKDSSTVQEAIVGNHCAPFAFKLFAMIQLRYAKSFEFEANNGSANEIY
jgi:hypothetical protein